MIAGHLRGPEGGDCFAQAVGEGDGWLVAKIAARTADVGLRMPDVARTRRTVLGSELAAQEQIELADKFEQAGVLASPDVVDVAGCSRRVSGLEQRLHRVGDVGKIARLLSVAVYDRPFAGLQRRDEQRNDPEYGLFACCRGPKMLKNRSRTVGSP